MCRVCEHEFVILCTFVPCPARFVVVRVLTCLSASIESIRMRPLSSALLSRSTLRIDSSEAMRAKGSPLRPDCGGGGDRDTHITERRPSLLHSLARSLVPRLRAYHLRDLLL